ncbi:MAG: WYL domain-containing protein [Oceanospirillaceae bacterium]|nr:WYL domain-containing protein [Oceanospirillaceae bacterium]
MASVLADLKWEVLLRYRYIEIIAHWEGRLTTNHLCSTFGIKRQQASRDINQYKELAPANLLYDTKLKGYAPSPGFKPIFTAGSVDEYLNLLDSHSLLEGFIERVELPSPNTQVVRAPARRADPEVVRKIVEACRKQQRLELVYASFQNPLGEERIISPHTLVSSGYRWHVRAFCERNREFRDFVLARILHCGELHGAPLIDASEDSLWHEEIVLSLITNPNLSAEQQAMVRLERCFDDEVMQIPTRRALAIYLLQLMQVPTEPLHEDERKNPAAFPVVLDDYHQLQELSFGRKIG